MKQLNVVLTLSLATLLFSCGNGTDKEETKTADTTAATVAAEPAVTKPAFTPFKVVVIQHKVKDFDKAQAGYFKSDSLLQASGITHYVLGRDLKDSNTIFVMDKIEDVDKSKAFFNQPAVVERMKKAGVSRAPGYTYAEMVRMEEAAPTPYGVSVTHHVKDYDAWVKAFDAERGTRPGVGLVDRGIARNLYDSNTVSILFGVTDLDKAKARMASPELKKIMADAGVDGTPAIRWYREVK